MPRLLVEKFYYFSRNKFAFIVNVKSKYFRVLLSNPRTTGIHKSEYSGSRYTILLRQRSDTSWSRGLWNECPISSS